MEILSLTLQPTKAFILVQVCALNLEGKYDTFLEEVHCALSIVLNTESVILMDDSNAHVGVDAEKWNGVI
ncbi:unnamed protein product [Soboliphyme baturini]|uniref:Endo/exonuclease/phosphatase domain-containing protein n=1 Tax=Soboliphyme baturini TaxID=241478 RepID=A0A183IVR6_9BILA|nr:unnamed protein product [Soboliphyme baturini]